MVLEIKVPYRANFMALRPMLSVALSYVLRFIYIGIYWNNHRAHAGRECLNDYKSANLVGDLGLVRNCSEPRIISRPQEGNVDVRHVMLILG